MKATVGFMFFLLFLAGIALVNLGSLQAPTAELQPPSPQQLQAGSWVLRALHDSPAAASAGVSMQFTRGGTLAIAGACNRLAGDYRYDAGRLAVAQVLATKRACEAPAMAVDAALAAVLESADRIATDGRQIIFMAGEERLARFAPAGPDDGDP